MFLKETLNYLLEEIANCNCSEVITDFNIKLTNLIVE